MLAIRMKRTGRRGHAQFRMIVQDSRFSPKSGRVVAYLGNYDPHTKEANLDVEKASQYLKNGAQPSEKAARLMKKEGVKLPSWVEKSKPKKKAIRNSDKLRRNRPAEEKPKEAPEKAQEPVAEVEPVESQQPAEEAPKDEPQAEQPEEQPEEKAEPDPDQKPQES